MSQSACFWRENVNNSSNLRSQDFDCRLNRKVSSNRYKKQKRKIAKIHQKTANQRSHFLHQITNQLVKNYDKIVIEDLNVKGMVKNKKLSKSISDASFSTFRSQLTYKCNWYDKELIIADRFYASSKTCSDCGNKKDKEFGFSYSWV